MYKNLSKSFLILACIFGLVFGIVVQVISDRRVLPIMPNGGIAGGQPTTDTVRQPPIPNGGGARTLSGDWSSAMRLTTGDIIAIDKIQFTSSAGNLHGVAFFQNKSMGELEGTQQGNDFGFRLTYIAPANGLDIDRKPSEIVFHGTIGDEQAAGTVEFTDDYRKVFQGTFTLVPWKFNAIAPTPSVPDGSSDSVIQGAWSGEFATGKYSITRFPLTLNLNHRSTAIFAVNGGNNGANIVGTGTINGKQYQIQGTIAGSSYNLVIGDLNTGLEISGHVTQDAMVGRAELHKGKEFLVPGDPFSYAFGEVRLTR